MDLVVRSPIFVKVDGTTPAFTQGGLPSVRDQVIANKFELDGTYTGSDFNIEEFTIQSICTFVVDDVSEAPSCDFEIEFAYCNTGRGGGGGGGNNKNNKKCYTNGEIFAKGQSSPFAITGGSRKFMGAFGQISGDIALGESFRFKNVEVRLCHYKNKPF